MKALALLFLLASCNTKAQDCVDLWQFFDGHDWVSVSESDVYIKHYGTQITTYKATYYNVPVRKITVCNQEGKR